MFYNKQCFTTGSVLQQAMFHTNVLQTAHNQETRVKLHENQKLQKLQGQYTLFINWRTFTKLTATSHWFYWFMRKLPHQLFTGFTLLYVWIDKIHEFRNGNQTGNTISISCSLINVLIGELPVDLPSSSCVSEMATLVYCSIFHLRPKCTFR